jgi:hypothetical protein
LADTRHLLCDGRSARIESIESSKKILLDGHSDASQRLRAVELLCAAGIKELTAKDCTGHAVKLRLEIEKCGKNRMVHLYANVNGKELVVLRGIDVGGKFRREIGEGKEPGTVPGERVSFYGRGKDILSRIKEFTLDDLKPVNDASLRSSSRPASAHLPILDLVDHSKINANASASNTNDGAFSKTCYQSIGTGYYPDSSSLEGGFVDKVGKPLHTLQDYLSGKAPYVSVAMDNNAGIKYGQLLKIPELSAKYGCDIPFRVVDTGGAFKGRGYGRIDICVANQALSQDSTINGNLTLQFQEEPASA